MRWSEFKEDIIYLFYNIAFLAVFIIWSPFLLFRVISGRYRSGLKERLGFLPKSFLDKRGKRVWIHAVSVGEVGAAVPIAREFKKIVPDVEIFFSTTTSTGQEVIRKRWSELCAGAAPDKNVFYYPLDFPRIVRRTLRYVQPDVFVAMETEIWPNLFRHVHGMGARVVVLNARISDKSFQGYRRIRFFLKTVFSEVSVFGAQTEKDGERIKSFGVDDKKIIVMGNSKFDSAVINIDEKKIKYFESLLGVKGKDVIIFGSTHPGEEEIILKACRVILDNFPDIRFVLCPRHPERGAKVEELVRMNSFKAVLRSELKDGRQARDEDFIILDTIGELSTIYGLATIVFVGGSLIRRGGQNMIEPAYLGKPILFGPYTYNFREIVKIFLEKDAACQIMDGEELKEKMIFFLSNRERALEMGRRARDLVLANRGAAKKGAELILRYLQ